MSIGLRLDPSLWGWFPTYYSDRVAGNLSAAATWLAMGVLLDTTRTLSKVRAYCTSTGSPVAADYRCELYSTTSNVPGSSLQTATVPVSVSNGAWIEWTGFSTSMTVNTQYWIVFKNLNASPATNFYAPNIHQTAGFRSIQDVVSGDLSSSWGWCKRATTNSGGVWNSSVAPSIAGIRLEFSDGYFAGFPLGALGNLQVYGSREAGTYFVSPDVPLNVKGVSMPFLKVGSPTGSVRYRIYVGDTASPTLQGTTDGTTLAPGVIPTTPNAYYPLFFNTAITIPANSVVRVVLSESTQSDASTNRYQLPKWDIENDANTKALMGSYKSTLSTDGGATFTDTDTDVVPFGLLLSTAAGVTTGGSEFSIPKKLPLYRNRRAHLLT